MQIYIFFTNWNLSRMFFSPLKNKFAVNSDTQSKQKTSDKISRTFQNYDTKNYLTWIINLCVLDQNAL